MTRIFSVSRPSQTLALLGLAAAFLAGCGVGGSSGIPIGSRLSVFDLRGAEPVDLNDRSDDKITVDGVAVRAEQGAAGTSLATGSATMTIFFGGSGFRGLGGGVVPLNETRDIIDLDAFGTVITEWLRHLDSAGGTEDAFVADIETSRDNTVYQTSDGRLTLRNMDQGDGSGLSYATYGYWNAAFAPFDRLVAFTAADPNAGTTVPAMGMAVYQGGMTGLYSTGFGAPSAAAEGDASLMVDFGGGTVSGQITGITAGAENLRDVELQQTALTGSTFAGTASTLPPGPGQTGPDMGGDYLGALYGPSAPEAVGLFAVTGAAGEALVGGFAAQQ
jgi:hypothetical protein